MVYYNIRYDFFTTILLIETQPCLRSPRRAGSACALSGAGYGTVCTERLPLCACAPAEPHAGRGDPRQPAYVKPGVALSSRGPCTNGPISCVAEGMDTCCSGGRLAASSCCLFAGCYVLYWSTWYVLPRNTDLDFV